MADNGKPKIGRHARCLGMRPNIDEAALATTSDAWELV